MALGASSQLTSRANRRHGANCRLARAVGVPWPRPNLSDAQHQTSAEQK